MKSNKQRRAEILAHRKERAITGVARASRDPRDLVVAAGANTNIAPCNPLLLAPSNSYGVPEFVSRGYYVDQAFICTGCQAEVRRIAQDPGLETRLQPTMTAQCARLSNAL